ncbi:MAG: Lrp/AsnC ligand binding domain-containing protein [Candidatus Bathyarchaeota archaeon]
MLNTRSTIKKKQLLGLISVLEVEKIVMAMAYVLINTEPKHMEDIAATLEKLDSVVEIFPVYGVYDLVAKIQAETMEKLKDIVTWKIRNLKNVRSTITMLILDDKQ